MRENSNKPLLIVASILLAIPVVALLWVDSYAKVEPTLAGFPFFIWYQFLWVFLWCSVHLGRLPRRPHRSPSTVKERARIHDWRQLSRPGGTGWAVPVGYGHGFLGIEWRRGEHLASLDEWGLGGRTFGTWITWFLLGGDLYTAYTFVAVPAAMFALAPSLVFSPFHTPSFCTRSSSCTWPGFGRSAIATATSPRQILCAVGIVPKGLSLAVSITGILATMPYIALQLVGIQAVLEVVGLGGTGSLLAKDLPCSSRSHCSPHTRTRRACARRR